MPKTAQHDGGWSDARIETLKKSWAGGKSASEIAMILVGGVTRNAVISKVHRLGLSGRASPLMQAKPKPKKRSVDQVNADHRARTKLQQRHGNAAQPKANAIVARAEAVRLPRAPMPKEEVADGSLITLVDLTYDTCRWPIGDPKDPGFGFCGAHPQDGSIYCSRHHRKAYVTV